MPEARRMIAHKLEVSEKIVNQGALIRDQYLDKYIKIANLSWNMSSSNLNQCHLKNLITYDEATGIYS